MIYLWKDVEPVVRATLRDDVDASNPAATGRYSSKDLIVWWNFAQSRLSTHKPLRRHAIYLPSSWKGKPLPVVNVPHNFYNHVGLFANAQNTPIERVSLFQATFDSSSRGFYINEDELVVVGTQKESVERLLFFYNAYYEPVEGEKTIVEVPYWAIEACSIYVAIQATTREAMADSRYRKYISSEDAGTPVNNPFIPVAKFLKERFYEIIQLHQDDDPEFE